MQDVRYAVRSLLRHRAFTATAILTLAVGLGGTIAILSLVNTAWLGWASTFAEPDRLTMLFKKFPSGAGPTSPYDFRDWQRDATKSFSGIAGYMRFGVRLTANSEPLAVGAAATSATLFPVLGIRPVLGRFYRADEEQWGRNNVAVLSYRTWRNVYAGDPAIVGRTIQLDDAKATIIGVAPEGAWFGSRSPDVFVPLSFSPTDPRNSRNSHFIQVIGRLAPGVPLAQASAELRTVASRIEQVNPENAGTTATVEPLADVVLGDVKPTLRLLMGAVLLVLIIACANVANLMLLRSASRRREIAVRTALGASARRIGGQILTEGFILATAGGVFGVILAIVMVNVLGGTLPLELPRISQTGIRLDWRLTAFAFALIAASGLACGLLSAAQLSRGAGRNDLTDGLREGSRGASGGKRSGFVRNALVVAQVSVALILLVTSGLFVRSLTRLQKQSSGVRADGVLSVRLSLSSAASLDSAASVRFFDEALRRVAALPGVRASGVSSNLPLSGGGETKSFYIEGREPASLAALPKVVGRMESASSLGALGMQLVRGRWFSESDRRGAPNVAVIGESVAKRFFGGENPIGKRIGLHPPENLTPTSKLPPGGRWPRWTVVGVVKDVNYGSPRDEPESAVYVHYPQGAQVWSWGPRWLVARASGDPTSLINPIRSALHEIDPTMPLGDMLPLTDRMTQSLRAPRFTAGLVATFAVVSLLLGVIGLYGVVAYSVSQETRSFGIRIALGATRRDVSGLVLKRGARLAGIGLVVGCAGAAGATRLIQSQLFGVAPLDFVSFALAVSALLGLTLFASYIPARRAARIDPLTVMRSD